MARSYLEDDHIADESALGTLADGLKKLGKGADAIKTTLYGFQALVNAPFLKPFNWVRSKFGYENAVIGSASPILAGLVAAGSVIEAAGSFSDGEKGKGVKQLLRGAAEAGWVYFNLALLGSVALIIEPLSYAMFGKTTASLVGDVTGKILDMVGDMFGPKQEMGLAQRREHPALAPQMALQPALQPAMGMAVAPQQQPVITMTQPVWPPQQVMVQQQPGIVMTQPVWPPQAQYGGMLPGGGNVTAAIPASTAANVLPSFMLERTPAQGNFAANVLRQRGMSEAEIGQYRQQQREFASTIGNDGQTVIDPYAKA